MVTRQEAIAEAQRRGILQEPSGISREQALAEAQRRGILPADQPATFTTPAQAAAQGEGFISRAGQDLGQRAGRLGQTAKRQLGGEQSLASSGLQLAGETIGGLGDLVAQGAVSGFRALPDIVENPIRQVAGAALGALGSLPSAGGGTLAQAIPQEIANLGDGFSQFEAQNPVIGANLRALGNVASVAAPPLRAEKALRAGAGAVKKSGEGIVQKASDLIPEASEVSVENLSRQASAAYDVAESSGAKIKPALLNDAADEFDALIKPDGKVSEVVAQEVSFDGQKQLQQLRNVFDRLRDDSISIKDYNELDKTLTQILRESSLQSDKGGLNRVGSQIKDVQENVRSRLIDAGDEVLEGSSDGIETLKKARDLYSAQARLREIEDAVYIATQTGFKQPKTALQTQMRGILRKIRSGKLKGFKENEISAIEKAADGGRITEITDLFGSRLVGSIAAASNPVTGIAFRGASEAPRKLSELGQLRRVSKAGEEIASPFITPASPELRGNQALGQLVGRGLRTGGGTAENALRLNLQRPAILGQIQQEENQ